MEEWMSEARQLAGQCWCDVETQDRIMDPPLAEAFAKRLAAWMYTAAQETKNTEFYRKLLVEIGEMFGDKAKIADDNSVQEDVIALRVPELVRELIESREKSQE